jgi:opacity protein-like surface antigen
MAKQSTAFFVGALMLALLLSANARAQVYVGAEFGVTRPNDFSNISGTGGFAGNTLSDLRLKDSYEYGLRVGYFMPSVKWLGLEAQWFNTYPHIKGQSINIDGAPAGDFPGSHVNVNVWAFNLIGRLPLGAVEPYVGAGPGLFVAKAHGLGTSGQVSSDTTLGLNAFAGARFFVTESMALFAEYKYDRAHFTFDNFAGPPDGFGVKGTYSAHTFSVGILFNLSRLLHL